MPVNNIFANIPTRLPDELCEVICCGTVQIERIVSHGQASPPDFWYDQDRHEWVIVLQGRARLTLAGVAEPVSLAAGDYLNIPAHTRHRVEWTAPDQPTVWLAVHY